MLKEKKRKCQFYGCTIPLNGYNENACCSLHQIAWVERMKTDIIALESDINNRKRFIKEAKRLEFHYRAIGNLKVQITKLRAKLREVYRNAATIKLARTTNFND